MTLTASERLRYFERAALVVSLTATGLGVISLMGSSWWWVLGVVLTIVSSAGTLWALGAVNPAHRGAFLETPPTTLLVLGATVFLHQVDGPWRWVALAVAVVLLVVLLLGRFFSLDPANRLFGAARFSSSLVCYLLALGYFAGIYGARMRTLESGAAIALIAFLLALYTLGPRLSPRSWLASGVVGLMMAEVTWGLNYWHADGLVGGLFLLLVFYGLTGTLHNYLLGRLTRGVLAEFVGVVLVGLTFLAATSFIIS